MIRIKKIHAGALQFVVFVGAIVAALLMAFMLLSFTHSHFDKQTESFIAVVKSADFGMKSSLAVSIPLKGSIAIKNEKDIPVEIKVNREFWGVFEKRTVTTTHKNISYQKTALLGGKEKEEISALYVNEHQRPVILAGNSKITGTAFLPEQGLKMGNIYGNSYHHSTLLFGKRMKSDSNLPKLSTELRTHIEQLTSPNFVPEGRVQRSILYEGLQNSFSKPVAIIRDRVVRLKNVHLTGNIIISASSKIIVEPSAKLQDVILLAPEIIVQNWVKGNFQAIATESITVGKKCELAYPTALVVKKKERYDDLNNVPSKQNFVVKPAIYLDAYAKVRGIVMSLDEDNQQQYVSQIKMDTESKVIGEVYCSKNLELKGKVSGTVFTDAFIALEDGSVYQNHLYNGSINSTHLDESYTGILLENRLANKKVMKWLY